MSKFLYYVDIHHGETRHPYDASSILLHGDHSIAMQRAVNAYAKNNNITAMIHGGDESYYDNDLTLFRQRAGEIADEIKKSSVPTYRIIGNHEPILKLDDLGFLKGSFTRAHDATTLVCLQPEITEPAQLVQYSYAPDKTKNILTGIPAGQNIIIASHWSFGRITRGYGRTSRADKAYLYRDTLHDLNDNLKQIAGGNPRRVLNLSGHEHRFSFMTDLGYQCLVMPAIVQNDIDEHGKPCGLFAEITDDADDGSLRITFRKISLNTEDPENSTITTVSQDYMQRYFRPIGNHYPCHP